MLFPRNETPDNAALQPKVFVRKNLTSTESDYGNIEKEGVGIYHGIEAIHHYCFTHEVSMITDHKVMVAIFK